VGMQLERLQAMVDFAGLASTGLFLVTVAASSLTGRSLARRIHDAMLARRLGGWLRIVAIGVMPLLVLLAAFNIATIIAMRIASIPFTLLSALTGRGGLGSMVVSASVLVASIAFFSARYRGVDEPLTREGKLLLRPAERFERRR